MSATWVLLSVAWPMNRDSLAPEGLLILIYLVYFAELGVEDCNSVCEDLEYKALKFIPKERCCPIRFFAKIIHSDKHRGIAIFLWGVNES